MPRESQRTEPSSRTKVLIELLRNSQELALHQLLQDARDVLRAAAKVSDSFGIELDGELDRMDEKIMSKPWRELAIDYDLLVENLVKSDLRQHK